jgi:hypothetical protein
MEIYKEIPQKTQSSLKLKAADCILKEETRMQHSGIAQSSKHADTFTDGTVSPGCFFAKVLVMKAPRDLHSLQ